MEQFEKKYKRLRLPIVMWVAFLIASVARKDKAKEKLDLELMESNLSADEIMKIGDKYNVDYHGQKDMFTGAENSYREGDTVELSYGLIATDTDYSFIVDGQVVKANWNEKKGYIIKFTMTDHDIDVYCTQSNSMIKR